FVNGHFARHLVEADEFGPRRLVNGHRPGARDAAGIGYRDLFVADTAADLRVDGHADPLNLGAGRSDAVVELDNHVCRIGRRSLIEALAGKRGLHEVRSFLVAEVIFAGDGVLASNLIRLRVALRGGVVLGDGVDLDVIGAGRA